MNRYLVAPIAIVCPLALVSCGESTEEVRAAFDTFDGATDRRVAQEAMGVMDPVYFEHMDYLIKLARTGSRERVLSLPAHERMEIVAMRNRLTRDELSKVDGAGWVRLSIERGWWAADPGEPALSIGRVTFRSPRASGELLVDGQRTGLTVEFVKTNDQWLVDPRPVDEWWGSFVSKRATSAGNLDQMILNLESVESGKRVNQTIWDPPK
ncbi:MAG: hypothetical protein WD749_05990 [Phycisphaerales bacterium]